VQFEGTSSGKGNGDQMSKVNPVMNREKALQEVLNSFRTGTDLRNQVAQDCSEKIVDAAVLIAQCLGSGGKLLFFGNGGSAADAQHLAAEFVGRFQTERQPLSAIALTTNSSILTAVGNDYGFDQIFSRQVQALGRSGDVAIGVSTSGNSPNVTGAIKQAAKQGLKTIGLAGKDGGSLAKSVDISITVASTNTGRVQECHITIGHILCELVENDLS
jgi:D-sedoheptulose 7-phosphate isomerase